LEKLARQKTIAEKKTITNPFSLASINKTKTSQNKAIFLKEQMKNIQLKPNNMALKPDHIWTNRKHIYIGNHTGISNLASFILIINESLRFDQIRLRFKTETLELKTI
jgi:hypothetical protein